MGEEITHFEEYTFARVTRRGRDVGGWWKERQRAERRGVRRVVGVTRFYSSSSRESFFLFLFFSYF